MTLNDWLKEIQYIIEIRLTERTTLEYRVSRSICGHRTELGRATDRNTCDTLAHQDFTALLKTLLPSVTYEAIETTRIPTTDAKPQD